MRSRGHVLRLTAVSTLVVLALTGFSTGRHGHGGGGGGGCSSSSQDHDTSSTSGGTSGSGSYGKDYDDDYDDYDDDSYGSTGGSGSGTPALQDATAELVSCATAQQPYATVEVTNPNDVDGVFTVTVTFEDARGDEIVSRQEEADVPADDTATVRVQVGGTDERAATVAHCDLDPTAEASG
ncbi:hypothetical protein GCM10010129_52550 [Streptomyces fumigatiscleroticus]|nr:hypothetical protein GCM10010129_52550 [Streptomyces fumigatiscleroticus]